MHPSIPSSLSNGNEGGIEDKPTNQPTQTSFRFDPNPSLTTMRAPTIIMCWYTSTFLSFHLTSAAPGGRGREGEGVAVAIDFGAVTEKFPPLPQQPPDASQQQQQQVVAAKTLQREQKLSKSQRPEPVRLWIDDFGNIEAVPVVSKAGLDDDDDSSSSSSTENSAPGSSGIIKQQPPPSQPPNPQKKNHHPAPPAPRQQRQHQQRQQRQQRQLQDFRTKEKSSSRTSCSCSCSATAAPATRLQNRKSDNKLEMAT